MLNDLKGKDDGRDGVFKKEANRISGDEKYVNIFKNL